MKEYEKMSRKKRTKLVIWLCDKLGCGASNTRKIKVGDVIIDDECDSCNERIHEPLTMDLKDD